MRSRRWRDEVDGGHLGDARPGTTGTVSFVCWSHEPVRMAPRGMCFSRASAARWSDGVCTAGAGEDGAEPRVRVGVSGGKNPDAEFERLFPPTIPKDAADGSSWLFRATRTVDSYSDLVWIVYSRPVCLDRLGWGVGEVQS